MAAVSLDVVCGAHEWNRTIDLLLTKEVLYRLSYVSVEPGCLVTGWWPTAWSAMERETGIEPAPSAWKAEVLPLHYSRDGHRGSWLDTARTWWREVDANHRRRKPADLQSAPVGRLGIPPVVRAVIR